jgi:plastocyanin
MHRRAAFVAAAVLGASVAVLPAIAGSETAPTIEAVNVPAGLYSEEQHYWQPAQATVAPGGAVPFRNATAVPHGVHWVSGPETPSCSAGVPVGTTETAAGTNWSGACTFSQPGSYTFYCTVHGAAMSGTIHVEASGTTTATTTTSPGGEPPPGGTTTASTPQAPPAGPALQALKLPTSQRGGSVRGSLLVSPAGAGGRLEVDLLARRGSLASVPRGSARVRVGRLIRASLSAGATRFAVALDRRARSALHRRGRLALSVRIVLTPVHGPILTLTRAVVERR